MMSTLKSKIFIFILIFVCLLGIILFFLETSRSLPPIPFSPIPTVTLFPTPLSPTKSPSDQGIGGEDKEFLDEREAFYTSHPILQKIPLDNPFFSIEYISEAHLIIHSETDNIQRDFQEAQRWFEDNNIDTTKILLEYKSP